MKKVRHKKARRSDEGEYVEETPKMSTGNTKQTSNTWKKETEHWKEEKELGIILVIVLE